MLEQKQSDIILTVEVLAIGKDRKTFTFKVIEVFKGGLKAGDTLTGANDLNCGPNVETKGKWLIYAKKKAGKFEVNSCGLSRSFSNPERNINIAPLLSIRFPKDEKEAQSLKFKNRAKEVQIKNKVFAHSELEKELRDLRKMKS